MCFVNKSFLSRRSLNHCKVIKASKSFAQDAFPHVLVTLCKEKDPEMSKRSGGSLPPLV